MENLKGRKQLRLAAAKAFIKSAKYAVSRSGPVVWAAHCMWAVSGGCSATNRRARCSVGTAAEAPWPGRSPLRGDTYPPPPAWA